MSTTSRHRPRLRLALSLLIPASAVTAACVEPPEEDGLGAMRRHHRTASASRTLSRTAAAERRMSSSLVRQLQTEIRIAGRPRQRVPASQQVPSYWICVTTSPVSSPD